jgi:hypothetical protein
MRPGLTIDLLFPIKDAPSAKLMSLKADRLCAAGVIDGVEKRAVLKRAATIVSRPCGVSGLNSLIVPYVLQGQP